jgi:hypothetical protein
VLDGVSADLAEAAGFAELLELLLSFPRVRTLLTAGAAVNKAAEDGGTPFLIACDDNGVEVLRALLAAGADSNTVSVHAIDLGSGKLTYRQRGVINVPAPILVTDRKPSMLRA